MGKQQGRLEYVCKNVLEVEHTLLPSQHATTKQEREGADGFTEIYWDLGHSDEINMYRDSAGCPSAAILSSSFYTLR